MKKVLIVVPSYSSGGGAEKILSNILSGEGLDEFEFDIVEIFHGDKGFEPLPSNARVISSFYSTQSSHFINRILMQFGKFFPKLLRKFLIKKEYDVEIFFEMLYPDIPFSKKCQNRIAWVHGSIEELGLPRYEWRKKHYSKHFMDANTIVAISNKTKKSILDLYPDVENKLKIIYNGYRFNEIIEKSKEDLETQIAEKSICSVGRIEKHKGSDQNVELIRNLHAKGFLYHFYFIGSGELEEELKIKVKEYGLEDYIHFLGYQKNPYKYVSKMKCLLSLSLQEGFPGVYVEAMSLGVPFVSTDVGGAEELSQNGLYGKIIDSLNEAEEKVMEYLEENDKFDKTEMYEFISNFTVDKQVKSFKNLIQ